MSVGNKILQAAAGNAGGPIDAYYIDGTAIYGTALVIDGSDNIYLGHGFGNDTAVTKIDDTPSVVWSKSLTGGTVAASVTKYDNYGGKFLYYGDDGKIHIAGRATQDGTGVGYYVRMTTAGAVDLSTANRRVSNDYALVVGQSNSSYIHSFGNSYYPGETKAGQTMGVRIDPSNGNKLSSRAFGQNGYQSDVPNSLDMDSSGNPIVGFTVGVGVMQVTGSNGNLSWYRFVANNTTNYYGQTKGVRVDSNDNVIVVGWALDSGTAQCIIAKYNSSGTRQWVKKLVHGSKTSKLFSVNVDSSDNIYAFGIVDPTNGGDNAPFICKFSSAGALTYQHHFDAPDSGLYGLGTTGDLVINSSGNPIIAAEGSSTRTYLFFVNEELTDNSSDLTLSTITTADGGSISSATYTSTYWNGISTSVNTESPTLTKD